MFKISIYGLRPFKYNNTCELCDKILNRDKRGIIMVNKYFALHEEDMDVFHDKLYIPTIEKCHLVFLMSGFLAQWNVRRIEVIVSVTMYQKIYKAK